MPSIVDDLRRARAALRRPPIKMTATNKYNASLADDVSAKFKRLNKHLKGKAPRISLAGNPTMRDLSDALEAWRVDPDWIDRKTPWYAYVGRWGVAPPDDTAHGYGDEPLEEIESFRDLTLVLVEELCAATEVDQPNETHDPREMLRWAIRTVRTLRNSRKAPTRR